MTRIICLILFILIFSPVQAAGQEPDPAESEIPLLTGTDLFSAVNTEWIREHPIPEDRGFYSAHVEMQDQVMEKLREIIQSGHTGNDTQGDETTPLIVTFYQSGMDRERRDRESYDPIRPELDAIQEIRNRDDLTDITISLLKRGLSPLYEYYADQDVNDSSRIIAHLKPAGLGLPDRGYYIRDDPSSIAIQNAYRDHIRNVFLLSGSPEETATMNAEIVYRFERELAISMLSGAECPHPRNLSNTIRVSDLVTRYPRVGCENLAALSPEITGEIDIHQTRFLSTLDRMMAEEPVGDWTVFLTYRLIDSLSPYLSTPFDAEHAAFYDQFLEGVSISEPEWKQILKAENDYLGDLLGAAYADKYDDPAAYGRIREIAEEIRTSLAAKIDALTWMNATTKETAREKLDAMRIDIGSPGTITDYTGLNLTGSYLLNILSCREYRFLHGPTGLDRIGRPGDPERWFINPQDVNMCYRKTGNVISIPTAILEPPFYDPAAGDVANYGSIGVMIGHEMIHGFDSNGRRYDAEGNLRDWWTEEDLVAFSALAGALVDQYNRIEVLPGITMNGNRTLSENIADIGGLSLAYEVLIRSCENSGLNPPYPRFFIRYATAYRGSIRDEALMQYTRTNVHPWNAFRVNGAVSHLDAFYEAFPEVNANNTWYLSQKDRVRIW